MEFKLTDPQICILLLMLVHHAIFEEDEMEMFYNDPEIGIICKRNHSVRNIENEAYEIARVNQLIGMAMEG